jgi:hypothetical protein
MNEETQLWAAVISQALVDACWPALSKNSGSSGLTERERSDARDWLIKGGRDFHEICVWAGFEPSCVRHRANELAAQGWPQMREDVKAAA